MFVRCLKVLLSLVVLCVALVGPRSASAADPNSKIDWRGWDDGVFERAKKERKLVLLNLEAVWCHWCHVMEQETYADPEVQALLAKHYITLKVDQDSRPDLSNRYREYGWPATIFFGPSGVELAKRAGFIEPDEMKKIIRATVADPKTPEKDGSTTVVEAAATGILPDAMRTKLRERHYAAFDQDFAGLKVSHKFLDADSVDYSLLESLSGSVADSQMAFRTLEANLALVDPIWGGVYQYSTGGRWDRAHFEKIMSTQATNLRFYSIAGRRSKEPRYLQAAMQVRRYLLNFLRHPDGPFYTSQDADAVKGQKATEYFALNDQERRKIGIPKIDTHIYSRENGWAIASLTWLYSAMTDPEVLADAVTALNWIKAHRSLPEGGFRHDEVDVSGPYLGDSLAMGEALLAVYATTADRAWLKDAEQTMSFIDRTFRAADGGFYTTKPSVKSPLAPVVERAENIGVCRFANLLSHYLGKEELKQTAEHAMRVLATERMAFSNITEAGILLCDYELRHAPMHVTVVAAKDDPRGLGLFTAALKIPVHYRRIEWWDRSEGPLPNSDVKYPPLPKAAAFLCTNKRCSLPLFDEAALTTTVAKFLNPQQK